MGWQMWSVKVYCIFNFKVDALKAYLKNFLRQGIQVGQALYVPAQL